MSLIIRGISSTNTLHTRDQTSPGSARMSNLSVLKHIDLLSDRQRPPDLTGATVRQVCVVASEALRVAWVGEPGVLSVRATSVLGGVDAGG